MVGKIKIKPAWVMTSQYSGTYAIQAETLLSLCFSSCMAAWLFIWLVSESWLCSCRSPCFSLWIYLLWIIWVVCFGLLCCRMQQNRSDSCVIVQYLRWLQLLLSTVCIKLRTGDAMLQTCQTQVVFKDSQKSPEINYDFQPHHKQSLQ